MNHANTDVAGVVAPPPLIYGVPLAAGVLLDRRRKRKILPRWIARPLGLMLVASGALLVSGALPEFRRAGTSIDPRQPTTALVTSGSYRLSRNPLYLALTLMYAGVALLANSRTALRFLPGVLSLMRRGVIDREERYLEGKFGEPYREYKRTVRRWL